MLSERLKEVYLNIGIPRDLVEIDIYNLKLDKKYSDLIFNLNKKIKNNDLNGAIISGGLSIKNKLNLCATVFTKLLKAQEKSGRLYNSAKIISEFDADLDEMYKYYFYEIEELDFVVFNNLSGQIINDKINIKSVLKFRYLMLGCANDKDLKTVFITTIKNFKNLFFDAVDWHLFGNIHIEK